MPRQKLNAFDVTNLVIGSIIGADIFIASGIASGIIGPFSIFVWVIAGIFAIVIALAFAQLSHIIPKAGGPYIYAKRAFGNFPGFITGWSLWLAEWSALAVFPVAFSTYVQFFFPLNWWQDIAVKFLFILFLTATNYFGIRSAGKMNDILTIGKILPLFILMILGALFLFSHQESALQNYSPLLPLGLAGFGSALVLIFWAYAGFELATIPSNEIDNPKKTIKKAIITGMGIVMVFYLSINVIIIGMNDWQSLAADKTPLVSSSEKISSWLGISMLGFLIWIGALLSISGSDESGTIGTSRLGYAMAADGLFPRAFAKLHPKYKTPYVSLIFQNITAFLASAVGGITSIISFSVFCLSFVYLVTCLSGLKLRAGKWMPIAGAAISLYLITQIGFIPMLVAAALLLLGVPFYIFLSPKKELEEAKALLLSEEYLLMKRVHTEERFLGHVFKHVRKLFMK